MLAKRMVSIRKLAKMGKSTNPSSPKELLLAQSNRHCQDEASPRLCSSSNTPTGFFAVYVGEERRRFVVPTGYLCHPLLKMLLEKASEEFGFEQKNGLVVRCSVSTFQEILNAVECCNGRFDFGNLVQEFI